MLCWIFIIPISSEQKKNGLHREIWHQPKVAWMRDLTKPWTWERKRERLMLAWTKDASPWGKHGTYLWSCYKGTYLHFGISNYSLESV